MGMAPLTPQRTPTDPPSAGRLVPMNSHSRNVAAIRRTMEAHWSGAENAGKIMVLGGAEVTLAEPTTHSILAQDEVDWEAYEAAVARELALEGDRSLEGLAGAPEASWVVLWAWCLMCLGAAGILWSTLADHSEHPALLVLFSAMVGLPAVFQND